MENKLQLYRRPSIISATNGIAVSEILTRKAKEYDFSEAKILDYIGRSLNDIQDKINELQYDKAVAEIKLKQAKEQKELLDNLIAEGLVILGLSELKDKSSEVLSSLTIQNEVLATKELKQRKLTQSEMEEKLKGYGESLYITEEVEIQAKPITIKANYKKGAKVLELKPKDIKEMIFNKYQEIENEN